ncbi:MAG: carboxypeptidase regulatory-like domain-containing protein [Planctomycetes bacterium]|nr:carboxypeptidase regulatory-like domain-containing protein [Planctomycetota bacterium]
MSPLPGARVVVMGTSAMGTSEADGSFELDDVPAGEHWVSFFHPRLQALGVSAPSRQVSFSDNRTVRVELAVPSERTLLMGWCLSEQSRGDRVAIAGIVTDSLTGVAMPRAIVTAELVDPRFGDPPTVEVRTDNAGYYRMCSVPAGRPVKLQAKFGMSAGRSVQLTVPRGGSSLQDLLLLMSEEGTLQGKVVDYQSGAPLVGASVLVLGTGSQVLTDSVGMFILADLPPGRHLVVTESLGYDSRTDSVTVFSEEIVGIEVRMATGALEIEGLVVTARSRFGEETLNVGKRLDIMTRAEIERAVLGYYAGDRGVPWLPTMLNVFLLVSIVSVAALIGGRMLSGSASDSSMIIGGRSPQSIRPPSTSASNATSR